MKIQNAVLSVILSSLLLTNPVVGYAAEAAGIDGKNEATAVQPHIADAHRQAVGLAREQKFGDSLAILGRLYHDNPAHLPVVYDYIAVLNWAGQHEQAVAVYEQNKLTNAPVYVLQSVGRSYFQLTKYQQAAAIFARLAEAGEERAKAWQAEVLLAMGGRQVTAGLAIYDELMQKQPEYAAQAAENARKLMDEGRTDAGRRLFNLIIKRFPSDYHFRRLYADSLKNAGLYRSAFAEYAKLSLQPEYTAVSAAGIAETATIIGAYDQAAGAISLLADQYNRDAVSQRAFAAYDSRYRGSASTAYSLYDSYDRTYSSTWQMSADQNIGGAVSALVQTSVTRLGDDNIKAYADLKQYSAGVGYTGVNSDVQLWFEQYNANRDFSGYRVTGRYFPDDRTTIGFDFAKSPVIDLDTLRDAQRPLLINDNYGISFSRSIGRDQHIYAGMSQGHYSDGNRSTSYSLQFSRTMFDMGRDSLQYSAYWSKSHWDKISDWYGNPLSSKSYGITLNYRANDGDGYWLTGINGVWGADDDNPLEFWPSLQLEYGYNYSPHHSLAVGAAYGLRTDKASDLEGLKHNYRQFSLSYRADW